MTTLSIHESIQSNTYSPGNTNTGKSDWGNCQRCKLALTRRRVVIRREGGSPGHTKLLFIGEAPGEIEDATGYPFIGISGRILHQTFQFVPYQFEYLITNTISCRPVDVKYVGDPTNLDNLVEGEDYSLQNWNRDPQKAEIEACKPHIAELIESWKPKGIVYLGKVASIYKTKLPKLQMFHPAYIARLECKLYTVRKEAKKLNDFIESLQ